MNGTDDVVDKWDGILDAVPGTVRDGKFDIFDMMAGYRADAESVLSSAGYPSDIKSLIGRPIKERRIRDILRMLTYFRETALWIETGDAAGAALSASLGVQSALKARLRPVEPMIRIGKSLSKAQSKRAAKPRTRDGLSPVTRAERNEKILAHFTKSKLSKRNFSGKYAVKYGIKPNTLRLLLP